MLCEKKNDFAIKENCSLNTCSLQEGEQHTTLKKLQGSKEASSTNEFSPIN